jgi:hypothetical protein
MPQGLYVSGRKHDYRESLSIVEIVLMLEIVRTAARQRVGWLWI